MSLFALEARMKVAGGKLGDTKRTHRTGGRRARALAGRMGLAVGTFIMRPAGARGFLDRVTGGCVSPCGRAFPPATFIGPVGARTSGNGQLLFHRSQRRTVVVLRCDRWNRCEAEKSARDILEGCQKVAGGSSEAISPPVQAW